MNTRFRAFDACALELHLVKPITPERVTKAIARARAQLASQPSFNHAIRPCIFHRRWSRGGKIPKTRFVVRSGGRVSFVAAADIDWIEAAGNYAIFHVGKQNHMVRDTMSRLESQLATENHLRVSRSAILNLRRVKELYNSPSGDHAAILADGQRVPFTRSPARSGRPAQHIVTSPMWPSLRSRDREKTASAAPGGTSTPPPAREAQRLAAVFQLRLLDTAPEERFDRFTRLAGAALQMPVAIVSLVDDTREWLKSSHGLHGLREIPRDNCFAIHVLASEAQPVIVRDASKDRRFAQHPLVQGPEHLRFFAGQATGQRRWRPSRGALRDGKGTAGPFSRGTAHPCRSRGARGAGTARLASARHAGTPRSGGKTGGGTARALCGVHG